MNSIAVHICGDCGHLGSVHKPECSWARCKCERCRIGLTKREFQVLQQMALGKSMKEIGTALNMGTRTVETHRYNMLKKTGAPGYLPLVLAAVRANVIPLESLPTLDTVIYVQPH